MIEHETDPLDAAATLTTQITGLTIDAIRAKAAKIDTSNESGLCWTCDDFVEDNRRWCSAECRDQWSLEND
jgi:hypothetical protein